MSSSIKKNHQSVALTSTERMRQLREKQRKNQPDHASIAEARQQRPIPLSGAEQKCRECALKRQESIK
jgi:hypothetical protein